MRLVSKLIGLWVVGRSVSTSTPLMVRLMMVIAGATLFAVVAGVLGVALIFGIIVLSYMQLTAVGMEPTMAILVLMAIVLAVLAGVVGVVQRYVKHARSVIKTINYVQHPVHGRMQRIMDAFMDGYNKPEAASR